MRDLFSHREGFNQPDEQKNSLNKQTRIALFNLFFIYIENNLRPGASHHQRKTFNQKLYNFISSIWCEIMAKPFDELPRKRKLDIHSDYDILDFLKKVKVFFVNNEWFEVFDLIEFWVKFDNRQSESINNTLQQQNSSYRLTNGRLSPITNEIEINAIEDALTVTNGIKSINKHLITALSHLSNKKNPDYRNSIKESISAVESACKHLTNNNKAKFADALREFPFHSALQQGFIKIFGFTSDAAGIRHALLESDIEVDEQDAIFMLVSCSAFTTYLLHKKTNSTT